MPARVALAGTDGVVQRERLAVFALVMLGHLFVGWFLARAMRPPAPSTPVPDEVVMYLEFLPAAPAPAPITVSDPGRSVPPPSPAPPSPPVAARREAPPMQAVFEPAPAVTAPVIEPAQERIAPERDPFHRPAGPDGFGRQPPVSLPNPGLPRIAGERPVPAPIPELRARQWGAKEVVQVTAALFGLGGENAPVEAPCAGRVSAGTSATSAFSPNWRRDFGCGDEKDGAGYTGRVELPPGTVR